MLEAFDRSVAGGGFGLQEKGLGLGFRFEALGVKGLGFKVRPRALMVRTVFLDLIRIYVC